ncbi:tumor necrosis factor receptor superfamily member 19L [Crotalus adamanteus]|uniref:Tumor necrosis factor receptor superfamily member 19L n=1 Tax=Crotalus adamanteus TaxID=8729 RepID=A0AAW1BK32_CROAD
MACKPCPAGSFSPTSGLGFCSLHTPCEAKKRVHLHIGTATADTWCGACLPGYYSPEGETDPRSPCLPCLAAPSGVPGCQGSRKPPARLSRNAEAPPRRGEKTALNGTRDGKPDDSATQYAVLAIVPVFCIMGLLGILFCNLLMKKGYHCTAQKETDEEAAKSDRTGNSSGYKTEDLNEDTIGVLVRLITEKKENAAVLEEMLKEYHSKQLTQPTYKPVNKLHLLPQIPHICQHQDHLHTIQGLAMRSGPSCTRCSQKKWPEMLRSTEAVSSRVQPGEITILSVGRFRVARIPEQRANPTELKTISEGRVSKRLSFDCPSAEKKEQRNICGRCASGAPSRPLCLGWARAKVAASWLFSLLLGPPLGQTLLGGGLGSSRGPSQLAQRLQRTQGFGEADRRSPFALRYPFARLRGSSVTRQPGRVGRERKKPLLIAAQDLAELWRLCHAKQGGGAWPAPRSGLLPVLSPGLFIAHPSWCDVKRNGPYRKFRFYYVDE